MLGHSIQNMEKQNHILLNYEIGGKIVEGYVHGLQRQQICFEFQIYYLLVVWSWEIYFISLRFNFFILKMEIRIPTFWSCNILYRIMHLMELCTPDLSLSGEESYKQFSNQGTDCSSIFHCSPRILKQVLTTFCQCGMLKKQILLIISR